MSDVEALVPVQRLPRVRFVNFCGCLLSTFVACRVCGLLLLLLLLYYSQA